MNMPRLHPCHRRLLRDIALAGALAGLCAPAVATDAMSQPPSPVPLTLTVGVLPKGLPPFSILQKDPALQQEQIAGIGSDTLLAAFSHTEVHLKARVYSDTDALVAAACAQEIDIVEDLSETPDRNRCLKFSLPYFDGNAVTFGRANGPAYNSEALNTPKVRFAVVRGLLIERELGARYPKAARVYVSDTRDGLNAVASGRADFFTTLRPVADYVQANTPVQGITEVSSYREPDGALRFGVSARAQYLLAPLNQGLSAMSDDQRKTIWGKYVQPSLSPRNETPSTTFFLTPQERAYLATLPPLRVAFDANRPPYAYLDDSGQPSGIAESYLTWLSSALGVQFQRVPTGVAASPIDDLRAGKIDVAVLATRDNPLWQGLPISQPYATFPIIIVGRQMTPPVDGLNDLAGKRIATTRLSGLASSLRDRIPGAIWVQEDKIEDAMRRVYDQQADVYVGGLASADIILQRSFAGKLRIIGAADVQVDVGLALTPALGSQLLPIIDRAISAMPEQRKLDIRNRYVAASYQIEPSFHALLREFWLPIAGLLFALLVLIGLLLLYRKELHLRRHAEHDLSSQLDFQKTLLDTIPMPMVVCDPQGRYRLVNVAHEQLTGQPRASLLGKTARETGFWSEDNIRKIETTSAEALRAGTSRSFSLSRIEDNGDIRHFLGRIQPFGQTGDPDAGIILVADDVTDIRQAELLAQQAQQHAEAALRAKDNFMALMSHEIRTPMSGVLGLVELLAHTRLDQEQRAMVGMIEGSANALMQILNDILDYSKIEAGKVELEELPVDVRDLCDTVLGLLAASAHEKGLQLHLEVSDNVAAIICGDSVRLRHILFNLLGNAIKFTERGSVSLIVEAQPDPEADRQTIVWRVSDTGVEIGRAHV